MRRLATLLIVEILLVFAPAFGASDDRAGAAPDPEIITARAVYDPVFDGEIMTYLSGPETAPLVVLVHGLGDAGAGDWQPVIPVLARQYRVLALDLPGFARSSKGNHRYGPRELARAVRGAVSQFTDAPFILVGHSMGAAVSLAYADDYPGDVARLVLVSMAGVLHPGVYTESLSRFGVRQVTGVDLADNPWANFGIALATELLMERAGRLDIDPAILLQTFWLRHAGLRGQPAAIAALALAVHDFGEALRRLETPAVLIWGADDEVAPLRTGRVAAALMPHAQLVVMDGVGHSPMFEASEAFNDLLLHALAGEAAAATGRMEARLPENSQTITCSQQARVHYTGDIGHLRASGCQHVVVENANVRDIEIEGGRLEVIDSHVHHGIRAKNARLTLTAGSVTGDPPLTLENTQVDAAGTRFVTGGFVAVNQGTTLVTLWLSVAAREDRGARPRLIHDVVQVHDRW